MRTLSKQEMTSPSTDCISIRLWADKETALLIDCGIQLFMDEQVVPLEKKLITVVNSVTAKEEKLPALVRKPKINKVMMQLN